MANDVESLLDRVPPQSLEAEACALGAMLYDPDTAYQVTQILVRDDFYKPAHRRIFEAVHDLLEAGDGSDIVILRNHLEKRGDLEQIGGVTYLAELVDRVPTAANAEHYARIVKEKAVLRNLVGVASEIIRDVYEAKAAAGEVIDQAEAKLFEATQRGESGSTVTLREVLKETFRLLEGGEGLKGIPTGFADLDQLTNGLRPGELTILAARPSVGKSTLALSIARNVALNQGLPVLLFSLEMGCQQIGQNLLCSEARLDGHKMRRGLLDDEDWTKLANAGNRLYGVPIHVDESSMLSILGLRGTARRLKRHHDIRLIIVDYLQLMSAPGNHGRVQEVSAISRGLKAVAKELHVPVLALSQLNRAPEARDSNRPKLSDLRESGSLEQDADAVLLMFREDYYDAERAREKGTENIVELTVAKNRNGPTGKIRLTFLKNYLRFESYRDPARV